MLIGWVFYLGLVIKVFAWNSCINSRVRSVIHLLVLGRGRRGWSTQKDSSFFFFIVLIFSHIEFEQREFWAQNRLYTAFMILRVCLENNIFFFILEMPSSKSKSCPKNFWVLRPLSIINFIFFLPNSSTDR